MNHIKPLLPDALMLGGAAALAYGSSLLHPAAGYIVGGVALIVFGALTAMNTKETTE